MLISYKQTCSSRCGHGVTVLPLNRDGYRLARPQPDNRYSHHALDLGRGHPSALQLQRSKGNMTMPTHHEREGEREGERIITSRPKTPKPLRWTDLRRHGHGHIAVLHVPRCAYAVLTLYAGSHVHNTLYSALFAVRVVFVFIRGFAS